MIRALEAGATKASVCRTFDVRRSTLNNALARSGGRPSAQHKSSPTVRSHLPGPAPVMERQAEQREHRIVDLIRVDLHTSDATPPKPPLSTFFSAALGGGLRRITGWAF